MRKYAVPYLMTYDNLTRDWEVKANSKKEAREIAVEQLSTDQDVKHIASVRHIIDMGKAENR